MSFFIDTSDPDFRNLKPTIGYCFFIDISGSTELKNMNLTKWIIKIDNTFAKIRSDLYLKFRPLKSLGDELMFFIPEDEMKEESALTLLQGLVSMISIDDKEKQYFSDVKIAATFCNESYDITFLRDFPDIYGQDIDLTARLLSVACSREIIMNDNFVQRVRNNYNSIGNKKQFPEVENILGPWPQQFKGFKQKVNIYKITK